ncbi:MAG: biotin--[acetyl-CoA-carboxylase] ligase [Verrucomicrobiales bacterium]|jgi:BirA family biotin operon repressor/biotin-[acetyl-CoA-carboxylase] ligase|nr:biotin--[acetyl-CoA-carboxylase] ligase [Verrucomicrobiales bacterium]
MRWRIQDYLEVDSTSSLAAVAEPWTVIRAQRQRAGRGTRGRVWVSGDGGLWLSAVLPAPAAAGDAAVWPLLAGLALCEICRELGADGARLRWPNDLLIADRKVAGVKLDRPSADKIIVGIGVNLTQDPSLTMGELRGQSGRLQDALPVVPDRDTLTLRILARLVEIHAHDFAFFAARLAACWGAPRRVEIQVGERFITGVFQGVDGAGNPLLKAADGQSVTVSGAHVWRLRELGE